MNECMYIRTQTQMHTQTYIQSPFCEEPAMSSIYTHKHTYTHTHTNIHSEPTLRGAGTSNAQYKCIQTCIHTYIYTHKHTTRARFARSRSQPCAVYIHTNMHTYIYTHTPTFNQSPLCEEQEPAMRSINVGPSDEELAHRLDYLTAVIYM